MQSKPGSKDLGVYIHVPFCQVRCGYCDFNTYTSMELKGGGSKAQYPSHVMREMDLTLQADQAEGYEYEQIKTVFFGGGTPTLLPAKEQIRILNHLKSLIPFSSDVEITTEANPDSVSEESIMELAEAGFTRISFGMQSAVPRVLKILDRTHNPQSVPKAVSWAKQAGLKVSLDMIYATPGETLPEVAKTLAAIVQMQPDHVSAYSLIIEGNTKMFRQLQRKEITQPDPDFIADAYELIAAKLLAAGFSWYEVSNFAKSEADQCRHNLRYWKGLDWWGIGPGAHRHRAGMRAWNVKHPSQYATKLVNNELPVEDYEILAEATRAVEELMLAIRINEALDWQVLAKKLTHNPDFNLAKAKIVISNYVERGLLKASAWQDGYLHLSENGRLMADAIVRDILSAS